jgi:hypothetical protein
MRQGARERGSAGRNGRILLVSRVHSFSVLVLLRGRLNPFLRDTGFRTVRQVCNTSDICPLLLADAARQTHLNSDTIGRCSGAKSRQLFGRGAQTGQARRPSYQILECPRIRCVCPEAGGPLRRTGRLVGIFPENNLRGAKHCWVCDVADVLGG